METQRVAVRHRVLKAGTIEFNGGGLSCMVRNISSSGAALDVTARSASPSVSPWLLRRTDCICPATWCGGRKSGSVSPSTIWSVFKRSG